MNMGKFTNWVCQLVRLCGMPWGVVSDDLTLLLALGRPTPCESEIALRPKAATSNGLHCVQAPWHQRHPQLRHTILLQPAAAQCLGPRRLCGCATVDRGSLCPCIMRDPVGSRCSTAFMWSCAATGSPWVVGGYVAPSRCSTQEASQCAAARPQRGGQQPCKHLRSDRMSMGSVQRTAVHCSPPCKISAGGSQTGLMLPLPSPLACGAVPIEAQTSSSLGLSAKMRIA